MSRSVLRPQRFAFLLVCWLLLFQVSAEGRKLLQNFPNCPELNNYYINNLVPFVSADGINNNNLYVNSRDSGDKSFKPGRPGGPAGIRRDRKKPKRVAFSNITSGIDGGDGFQPENAPVADVDFSTTNVQVKGVDEPDIIKTDGKRVFTLSGDIFSVVQVLKKGKSGKRVGVLKLPNYPDEMLFEGDFILAIGTDSGYKRPIHKRFRKDPSYGETATAVYQIKIINGKPRLVSTLHLEGRYINSREVDGTVRLVLKFNPLDSLYLFNTYGKYKASQTKKWNREIIQYSRPGHWLPTYKLKHNGRVQQGVYVTCKEVYYAPKVNAGFNLLTVVTIPMNGLMIPQSSGSIMSDAERVYATKKAMYVTTSELQYGGSTSSWGGKYTTSFHRFNMTDKGATYAASGSVKGSVLNQWSMHDYRDTFFIATTEGAFWWSNRDQSKSKVTSFVLNAKTKTLKKVGEVGNLGVGERIYAVRYRSDTAYVVTFREVDPLYIIDLRNPRKLRVTGELKIPGYSSYLHYVGHGLILGVGQEATPTGVTTGAKVSLFDVSDKSNPRELDAWSLKGAYTNAEWDHRAFLYWRHENVAVMPVSVWTGSKQFTGAIILNISKTKITERGRITHNIKGRSWKPSIQRNAIIGKTNLWSMSTEILQVNDIKNLNKVSAQVSITQ